MAAPTNAFLTYSTVGIREDLSDLISNISPTDTPFTNGIGKVSADNTFFEWQTDSLAAASSTNAQLEGDDTTIQAVTPTVRLGNRCQISNKSVAISGTDQAVLKAGRGKNEMAYQIVKKTKELMRDVEAVVTQNQTTVAGNASTARKTGSLEAWLTTNSQRGASGGQTNYSNGIATAATDGTQRAFTEDLLKTAAQQCFSQGGDPDTLMVGPVNKQKVSAFTGNATRFDKSEDKRLVASVDIYESDFGVFKIVPNRFQRERTAFLLEMDMWAVAYLRNKQVTDLGKTGDSDKKLITVEYGLQAKNQASSAVIADLTTS